MLTCLQHRRLAVVCCALDCRSHRRLQIRVGCAVDAEFHTRQLVFSHVAGARGRRCIPRLPARAPESSLSPERRSPPAIELSFGELEAGTGPAHTSRSSWRSAPETRSSAPGRRSARPPPAHLRGTRPRWLRRHSSRPSHSRAPPARAERNAVQGQWQAFFGALGARRVLDPLIVIAAPSLLLEDEAAAVVDGVHVSDRGDNFAHFSLPLHQFVGDGGGHTAREGVGHHPAEAEVCPRRHVCRGRCG